MTQLNDFLETRDIKKIKNSINVLNQESHFCITNYLAIEFLENKGCKNPTQEMIEYTEKLLQDNCHFDSNPDFKLYSIQTKAIA